MSALKLLSHPFLQPMSWLVSERNGLGHHPSLPGSEETHTDKTGNSPEPQRPGARLSASCGPYPAFSLGLERLLIALVALTGLCFSTFVNQVIQFRFSGCVYPKYQRWTQECCGPAGQWSLVANGQPSGIWLCGRLSVSSGQALKSPVKNK